MPSKPVDQSLHRQANTEKPQSMESFCLETFAKEKINLSFLDQQLQAQKGNLYIEVKIAQEKHKKIQNCIDKIRENHPKAITNIELHGLYYNFMLENNLSINSYFVNDVLILDLKEFLIECTDVAFTELTNVLVLEQEQKLLKEIYLNLLENQIPKLGLFILEMQKLENLSSTNFFSIYESRLLIHVPSALESMTTVFIVTSLKPYLQQYGIEPNKHLDIIELIFSTIPEIDTNYDQNLKSILSNHSILESIVDWFIELNDRKFFREVMLKPEYHLGTLNQLLRAGLKLKFKDEEKTQILFHNLLKHSTPEFQAHYTALIKHPKIKYSTHRLEKLYVSLNTTTPPKITVQLLDTYRPLTNSIAQKLYKIITLVDQIHIMYDPQAKQAYPEQTKINIEDLSLDQVLQKLYDTQIKSNLYYLPNIDAHLKQNPDQIETLRESLVLSTNLTMQAIKLDILDLLEAAILSANQQKEAELKTIPSDLTLGMDSSLLETFIGNDHFSFDQWQTQETTSFKDVLLMGNRPHITCINHQTGLERAELLGMLFLEDRKLVQIFHNSQFQARGVLKLIAFLDNQQTAIKMGITIDNFYGNQEALICLTKHAFFKAQALNIDLCLQTQFRPSAANKLVPTTLDLFYDQTQVYNQALLTKNPLELIQTNHDSDELILVGIPKF